MSIAEQTRQRAEVLARGQVGVDALAAKRRRFRTAVDPDQQHTTAAGEDAASTTAAPRLLDFTALAGHRAPPKEWRRAGWVPKGGAILLSGAGGSGKSALQQHEATCGALGRPYFAPECEPYTSLVWNCEDEHDDIWRRQEAICDHEQIDLAQLAGKLHLVSRYGCENTLMAEIQHSLVLTSVFKELREQINDLGVDHLYIDNAAHVLLGNHDDRTHVTQFLNALAGLVTDRPFGLTITTHVSRAEGSEFTGSVAWENAVRMRWFLGYSLPDQRREQETEEQSDARYLCRRKSNFSARDYVRMTMREGLLVPDQAPIASGTGMFAVISDCKADEVCIAGFRSLCAMGIRTTDGKTSPDYLPSQIVAKGLACGFSKFDLGRAMNRLMGRGEFIRAEVGKNANRSPKFGLVLKGEQL